MYSTAFLLLRSHHEKQQFSGFNKERNGGRPPVGVFSKMRLIEKTCQAILGCDNVASVRLQGNDLTPDVVRRMAEEPSCAQLWPQVTPVDFDAVHCLIVLPRQGGGGTVSADALREGLVQLQSIAHMHDGEICILVR